MQDLIEAIILGLIQGLTEFIPVSSSGHLDIIPKIFGLETPSTSFITFLHFGTLISLLIYFRSLIFELIKTFFKYLKKDTLNEEDKKNLQVILNLIVATIPAALIGLFLEKFISDFYDSETNFKISAILILSAMIIIGVLFVLSNKLFKNNNLELSELKAPRAIIIGISQALAFFRGVSRSGITLLTGQAVGLSRVSAAQFGFLMSVPIMVATSIFSVYKLIKLPPQELQQELTPSLIGFIIAAVSGYLAIKFLLNYLKKHGLAVFGYYRIAFGIIALLIILSK